MIPKIIHYCWFGNNPLTDEAKSYIETWRKYCPDYEIIAWNESNFDVYGNGQYVKEAYDQRKWAFVSDYARLKALYEYGGIYLDTDVEVIKSFDKLLGVEAFIGAESKYSICTATIGACKGSKFIGDLLSLYNKRTFIIDGRIDKTPNSKVIFLRLVSNYGYKYSNNEVSRLDNVVVYPKDFFSPINCYTMQETITQNTISIHRYASTWKTPKEIVKDRMLALATRILGEDVRYSLTKRIKGK